MIRYSQSTNGFYDTDIHGKNIPMDAVEVSLSFYRSLMNQQAKGSAIMPSSAGFPVVAEQSPHLYSMWDGDKWVDDPDKAKEYEKKQKKLKLEEIEKQLSSSLYSLLEVFLKKEILKLDDLPNDVKKLLKERDELKGDIV